MNRGNWGGRFGFVVAAAGSAVGLGNIWKFPYITGVNGGGAFVLVYLACIALVGLPILIAEILLGRATQGSPVAAFRQLTRRGSPWVGAGWLGVASGFVILSYYSVVAGWAMHYTFLALAGEFNKVGDAKAIAKIFTDVVGNPGLNIGYHAGFMILTIGVVMGGVKAGIERWSKILMPLLGLILVGMLLYATSLDGFGRALGFVFGGRFSDLHAAGFLEALGHAFFTLSLGMGAMLTYGSYLPKETSIPKSALWVALLDTLIALVASMVIFPITFTHGLEPAAGPGLVFQSLPIAFSQMPAGYPLSILFFVLLVFAALTSAISLLEVVASTFIDVYGWTRRKATLSTGAIIFVCGIPSALSGGKLFGVDFAKVFGGKTFFDVMDYLSSNWMLPLGGLLVAVYSGYALKEETSAAEFGGIAAAPLHRVWRLTVRYLAPLAVLLVMLKSSGLLALLTGK